MRYWTMLPDGGVAGPLDASQIAEIEGFGSETLVCPERFVGNGDHAWLRAAFVAELRTRLPAAQRLLPPDPTIAEAALVGSLEERVMELETLLLDALSRLRERGRAVKSLESENVERGRDVLRLRAALKKVSLRVGNFGRLEEALRRMSDLIVSREEMSGAMRRSYEEGLETAARTAAETVAEAQRVIREASRLAEEAADRAEEAVERANESAEREKKARESEKSVRAAGKRRRRESRKNKRGKRSRKRKPPSGPDPFSL
jgi:hypothetical protein